MRRGQLVILYFGLSAICVLLGWRLVSDWKIANRRYSSPTPVPTQTALLLPPPSPDKAPPAIADITAKNLFSPDRNNDTAQDDSKPAPPVPVVFGTMNLGGKYEALMAERGQTRAFRRLKNGEQMAGYTILEINDEKVVVDYQGRKTTIDVYQSANSVPRNDARTATVASPVVESAGAPPPPPPSAAPAASARPATSGSASQIPPGRDVRVTVEGNRRRMERNTPFGPQVWYEDIEK